MIERQVAYKVRILDLLNGSFVKEAGEFGLGYIVADGLKVSRANLLASVVGKKSAEGFSELHIDDGSGVISVRSFDAPFDNFSVGDLVNVVGKVREFNNAKFVACEMISRVNDLAWVELRRLELEKFSRLRKKSEPAVAKTPESSEKADVVEEEVVESVEEVLVEEKSEPKVEANVEVEKKDPVLSPIERVLAIIRNFDKGDGVDIDDIISESKLSDCESVVNSLLADGDIFEVKPGKVKVLE